MMGDLIINGKDALETWGVRMGEGFLNVIDEFPSVKPYVENESRLEDGKRISVSIVRVASRQISLPFTIEGSSEADYRRRRKSFIQELLQGEVSIKIPAFSAETYRLVYLGKGASYGMSRDRCFSKTSLKFEEPNPKNRK